MDIIINVNPEEYVKDEHICYYVKDDIEPGFIALYNVVEEYFKHPQAPDHALISRTRTKKIDSVRRTDLAAGVLLLMEANQKAIVLQQRLL